MIKHPSLQPVLTETTVREIVDEIIAGIGNTPLPEHLNRGEHYDAYVDGYADGIRSATRSMYTALGKARIKAAENAERIKAELDAGIRE